MANLNVTKNIINQAVVPIGTVLDFAGTTPPQHYLLCNGQTVSRTDYAELFAIIGTTWGVGNGSTTFNVPNLQGRTTIGVGTNDGTTYNLGSRDGSKNAVVVSHAHNIKNNANGGRVGIGYGNPGFNRINNFTLDTDVGEEIVTTTNGVDGTDKNMMPYAVVNKIIRAE